MDYRSIFVLTVICTITVCYATVSCPPLSLMPGTVVDCEVPSEQNRTLDCVNGTDAIPKGTVGKYRCERDDKLADNSLKCGCKGRWRGIRIFNDFMSNCNISDYSIDGPAELNLTETDIQKLALPAPEAPNTKGRDHIKIVTVVDFQEDGVAFHNLYRNIHHSPALELNQTLSDAAQKWADHSVEEPVLKTQPWSERSYSQNLYRIIGNGIDAREAVKLAVAAWYQGAYRYDWENPAGQSAFTQLVWKSTTDVGLGVAQRGNQTVVVANYYPPGNIIVSNAKVSDKWAWFRINVLPPNSVNGNQNQSMAAISSSTSASTLSISGITTTTTTEMAPSSASASESGMTTTTTELTPSSAITTTTEGATTTQ